MNDSKPLEMDVLIAGGGVAGLWLLNRLRQQNINAWLIENKQLGGIQTPASQGIIHGGTKYALTGKLSESAKAIGRMPELWQACLEGRGELDLSKVEVFAQHQYLWSTGRLDSNLAQFFASKLMQSRMLAVKKEQFPELFKNPAFKGKLYQLNEAVINPLSLIKVLIEPVKQYCFYGDILEIKQTDLNLTLQLKSGLTLQSQQLILTAGAGNAELLKQLNLTQPKQQLRPLQMVILKGNLPPLYAHCLGASTTPKVTITSAQNIWYLGGQIAEAGVDLTPQQQIAKAKSLLKSIIPWVNTESCEWDTLFIDRAEPEIASGLKPADAFVKKEGRVITAWPTKLALTPRLSEQILNLISIPKAPAQEIKDLPSVPLCLAPWQ